MAAMAQSRTRRRTLGSLLVSHQRGDRLAFSRWPCRPGVLFSIPTFFLPPLSAHRTPIFAKTEWHACGVFSPICVWSSVQTQIGLNTPQACHSVLAKIG